MMTFVEPKSNRALMDFDLALALDHPKEIITSGHFFIYPLHFQMISGDGDVM
jgi:hypothetical protein